MSVFTCPFLIYTGKEAYKFLWLIHSFDLVGRLWYGGTRGNKGRLLLKAAMSSIIVGWTCTKEKHNTPMKLLYRKLPLLTPPPPPLAQHFRLHTYTRPTERESERPWKTPVTWLQNKINSEGGVLCLTFFCLVYSQRSRSDHNSKIDLLTILQL